MSNFQNEPSAPNRLVGKKFLLTSILFVFLVSGAAFVPALVFAEPATSQNKQATDKASDGGDGLDFATLQYVYRYIMANYVDEVDGKKLMEGMMNGMFATLNDPYSVYLPVKDWLELTDTTSGEFGGVGAYIEKQRNPDGTPKTDGFIEIAAAIEDTPAFKAGLRSGDLIMTIDSKSTVDLTSDEAVKLIRGKPDSTVVFQIKRGKSDPFKISLVRQVIQVPVLKSAMIGKTAYIRLIQFTPHTVDNLEKALKEMMPKNPDGLILDLRNNPGGLLDSALKIADYFFEDGPVLSTKGRMYGESQKFEATAGTLVPAKLPLVVLINGGSASASEILSGALHDRARAVLIGETTFGKGLVQRVMQLPPGDKGYKLTTSRYYTPSGVSIDKLGIKPDIELKEKVLSKEEEDGLIAIRQDSVVQKFVDAHQNPSKADIEALKKELAGKKIAIDDRYLNKLVKNEVDYRNNINPVYDLDFDQQLAKALSILPDWNKYVPKPNIRNEEILPTPNAKK